jgi:hemolysin activation/secretion protein
VYVQWTATNVLEGGIDTTSVKQTKELPPYIDVRTVNLGIDHEFSGTDYRYNPRKGTEYRVNVSGGLRKIRENSSITNLTTDASGRPFDFSSLYDTVPASSYLLRFRTSAAHYLRSGKASTFKGAVQAGLLFTENPFRNELFQIGGYKILRGFDEESIYADRYAVATLEYRILFGTNNYFFAFTDGGWAGRTTLEVEEDKGYLGFGGGMTLETKAGIFNLTVAAGKAGSAPVDFRRIKVHIGMVSLF